MNTDTRTTYGLMLDEVRDLVKNGESIADIRDRDREILDGYLPIYNGKIIEEWCTMPWEYTDRGATEFGNSYMNGIIELMSADLYLYYSDLLNEVIDEVEEETEEVEE
jgi:hypothetical protein